MAGSRRDTPNDPQRRARIIQATLDVIAEVGVPKTTHRRIAAQAGVPLGSVTYHFNSIDDLVTQAFTSMAASMSQLYRDKLEAAETAHEARNAVVELICGSDYAPDREMNLIFEMYAYANHHSAVADLSRSWMSRSRESLAVHFSERTCMALDALIEGWPIHRSFERAPLDRALVTSAVGAIVTALEGEN